MKLNKTELKEFLDQKATQYNTLDFIGTDPIQIPHHFKEKEDIEISGFLIATISWGNRKSIITNGQRLLDIMGNSPYDFVQNYTEKQKNTPKVLCTELLMKMTCTPFSWHYQIYTNNIKV